MGNFFYTDRCNSLCLCITLIVFLMTTMFPVNAAVAVPEQNLFNDVAFGIKIGKLVEKIKKYKDKLDQKKMLDAMVDLKIEIEGYTGKKINVDYQLDRVEKDLLKRGAKFEKDDFRNAKQIIKKALNRSHHKWQYMADCLVFNIEYNDEFERLVYFSKHEKDDNNDEIVLPLRVTIGVTMALCGFFLMCVPHPICIANGPWIMEAGAALVIDALITRYEEDENQKSK